MFKGSMLRGFLLGLLVVAAIGAVVGLRVIGREHAAAPRPPAAPLVCSSERWAAATRANRASLLHLSWSPFGRPETGWATYGPLIAREIGSACPPDSEGFAERYARWQARQALAADGVFKAQDFDRIRDALALRRPFVRLTASGGCPPAADEAALETARAEETYGGKVVRLRRDALEAYRRMASAARADGVASKPPLLRLVSGYRGPAEELGRCLGGGCDSVARARCSAHRTGLAVDLYLPPAPGMTPTSTDEANRRRMAASPEYRWLVGNAARFGFLPYAYEPWHWEWAGEAARVSRP